MKSVEVLNFTVGGGLVLVFLPIAWCHVIGGGLNTDFTVTNKETKSLLTALSKVSVLDLLFWETVPEAREHSRERLRPQHKRRLRPQHKRRLHRKKKPTAARSDNDLLEDIDSLTYERKRGRMFNSGDLITPLSDVWRRKREVRCSFPWTLYKQLGHLNGHHHVKGIFRFSVGENSLIPSIELIKCGKDFEHSNEECTVKVTERDLGPEYYPRYVRDLQCLQTTSSSRCQAVHLEVTVFRNVNCDNGKALMSTTKIPVTAGCNCDQASATA